MATRRRAIATAVSVVAAMSLLAPATAVASPEPVSTPRVMPANWPSTGKATVQPGGMAAVNSPALPTTAHSTSVTIQKDPGPDSWTSDFRTLLSSFDNKKRLLTCAAWGLKALDAAAGESPIVSVLYFAIAEACFDAVGQLVAPRTTRTSGCGPQTTVAAPVAVTHTSAGYSVAFTGPVRTVRPKFTARCSVNGDTLSLRIKAKKRKTLTRVLGPTINVGVAAAPTNAAPAPLAVTFNKPR